MGEVATKVTPAGAGPVSRIIARLRPDANCQTARLMHAHLWFESGNGLSIFNNNPGNLMAGHIVNGQEVFNWSGDYRRPKWYADTSHPIHALMMAGREPSAFRAYPTLEDGLSAYFSLVERMPAMKAAFRSGSPEELAAAVRSSRYCPACPSSLGKTLRGIMSSLASKGHYNTCALSPAGGSVLPLVLVAAGAAWMMKRRKR